MLLLCVILAAFFVYSQCQKHFCPTRSSFTPSPILVAAPAAAAAGGNHSGEIGGGGRNKHYVIVPTSNPEMEAQIRMNGISTGKAPARQERFSPEKVVEKVFEKCLRNFLYVVSINVYRESRTCRCRESCQEKNNFFLDSILDHFLGENLACLAAPLA